MKRSTKGLKKAIKYKGPAQVPFPQRAAENWKWKIVLILLLIGIIVHLGSAVTSHGA